MTQPPPPNPSTAHASVMFDELVRCGVRHVVVCPGSRSTALAMAAVDNDHLDVHVRIDERSAGFLAVGLARATGEPAVVVTTSGSAVANLHPAVVEADTGGVGMLLLTADRPSELHATGANQTIAQAGMFGVAVRWAVDLPAAEDRPEANALWRSTVARAVAEAHGRGGRPAGPVHLNLAFREPTVPLSDDGRARPTPAFASSVDGRVDGTPWATHATGRAEPPDALVAHLAALAGRRGVIGVADSTVDAGLLDDASRALGWPVVAEATADVGDGDVVAHADVVRSVVAAGESNDVEVVLQIGRPTASRALLGLASTASEVVLISSDGRWSDPARTGTWAADCDPDRLLQAVVGAVASRSEDGWRARWLVASAAAAAAVGESLTAFNEPSIAAQVAAAAAPGNLVVGSSMPIRDVDDWATRRSDLRVVANRGASGIDGFASTAVGVALGTRRATVALCGDLTFLHDHNGLLLGDDAPDLVFVVVDNDGGGIFQFLPQGRFTPAYDEVVATPHGLDLAAVVSGLGYEAVTVGSVDSLRAAISRGQGDGGVHVVLARTDRVSNVDVHDRLRESVTDAVRKAVAGGSGSQSHST